MPPKCKVRNTWPAIGPKGCKAKAEVAPAAKAAPAHAPVSDNVQRLRNKTYKMALQIKAKRKALEQAERARERLNMVNDTPLIRLQRNATRNIQLKWHICGLNCKAKA